MRALIICAVLRLTSQLAPQSLWRTSQQIASLDAHARTYESVIACTAREFLRGCAGVEAFSTTEHGCDCVLEGLNASLVDRGDGTALLLEELSRDAGVATLVLRIGVERRRRLARLPQVMQRRLYRAGFHPPTSALHWAVAVLVLVTVQC